MLPLLIALLPQGVVEAPASSLSKHELPFPAAAESGMPDLASGGDGRIHATWLEHGDTPRSASLFYARLEDGVWGEAKPVCKGEDWFVNWVDIPRIAALENGTLLATWLQRTGDTTYSYGVRFAVSRDAGATWTDEAWLHDDTSATEHGFVSLTTIDPTRFLAVWLDGRNTGGGHGSHSGAMSLRSREIEITDDAVLAAEESVIDERVCDCCPTALVGSSQDGVVCLFRDRSEKEVRDISYAFYGDGSWTAPGNLHADGWLIDGCPVNGPSIARRGPHLAAAWFTGMGEGGGNVHVSVAGRRGFEAPLDVDDGAPAGRVGLCFLADDSLLVSWLEQEEGRAAWRVRRLVFDGEQWLAEPSLAVAEVSSSRRSGVGRLIEEPTASGTPPTAVFAYTATDSSAVETVRLRVDTEREQVRR